MGPLGVCHLLLAVGLKEGTQVQEERSQRAAPQREPGPRVLTSCFPSMTRESGFPPEISTRPIIGNRFHFQKPGALWTGRINLGVRPTHGGRTSLSPVHPQQGWGTETSATKKTCCGRPQGGEASPHQGPVPVAGGLWGHG